MQACDDTGISFTIFVSKIDKIEKPLQQVNKIKKELGLKDIQYGSTITDKGMKKLKTYLTLWKGKRIIILGVFNSSKTSIINKLCNTKYEVGDIPGTTLQFTETTLDNNTVVIDSVGQLIDIHKPMMVSIDFSECNTREEKIDRVFDEEVRGLIQTKESSKSSILEALDILKNVIKSGNKIVTVGAGASALVAKEIAGQGTECGLPVMVFTNDGAEIQPITFSKGLGEQEGSISRYISNAINSGDCVIAVSASGGTGFVYDLLRIAKEKGAYTISITENPDTPTGKYSCITIKSDSKPEGPSSSRIMTAHLCIGHTLMLVLADELGLTADESIGHMLQSTLKNKAMGIK